MGVPAVRLQLSQHLRFKVDFEAAAGGLVLVGFHGAQGPALDSPARIRQIVLVIIARLIACSTGVGVRLEGHIGATQRLYECLWWCWVLRGRHDCEELVRQRRWSRAPTRPKLPRASISKFCKVSILQFCDP